MPIIASLYIYSFHYANVSFDLALKGADYAGGTFSIE